MSSCLSGSGRAYGLELEMLVKSPSLSSSTASTITSHSSSSSSPTLSESGSGANSPFTISTRKPRTPRKRPNQTYNEAAALLSTAYPRLFSPNNLALTKPCRFSKPPQSIESFFLGNSNSGGSSVPELLIPLRVVVDNPGFLLHVQPPEEEEPRFNQSRRLSTVVVVSDSRDEICRVVGADSPENLETESMLDGEIEEGIDSIMGMGNPNYDNYSPNGVVNVRGGLCFGYPIGWRMERSAAALRHADDEGDWWRHPIVDVPTPQLYKTQTEESKKKTKKKKKKLLKNIIADDGKPPTGIQEDEKPTNVVAGSSKPIEGLRLKLNHDSLLAAWSDRGSPFSEDPPGNDAKLAQVDLLSLSGEREASVLRYKEKRRTRLFSKKIRYQVRKVNADRRPRMKGRFVRRPEEDSPFS